MIFYIANINSIFEYIYMENQVSKVQQFRIQLLLLLKFMARPQCNARILEYV